MSGGRMNYSKDNIKKQRASLQSKTKKVKNKVGILVFRVFLAFVLIVGFALGGALIGAYLGIIENAPLLNDIQLTDEDYTTILYVGNTGQELDRLDGGESREYASLSQIPKYMADAFVSLEDERFYQHNGIDAKGILRVFYIAATTDQTQGASTITQQLIKNKLKIRNNTIETKLQEQYLAVNYEKALTEKLGSKQAAKNYILELYMNLIALGNGQNGVQAASLYYFGKDVSELTIAECAVIAAITQNPVGKNPKRFPEENRKRQLVALNNMLEFGYITQQQYNEAIAEDVYAKIQAVGQIVKDQPSFHSYFVDQVISQVSKDLQEQYKMTASEASKLIYKGGLSIETTMDPKIQAIVDEAYLKNDTYFPTKEFEIGVTYLISIRNEVTNKLTHHEETGSVKKMEDVDGLVKEFQHKLLKTNDVIESDAVYAAPQPQGAMVVMDYHTGKVVALAGGRGVKLTNRAFNRATDAKRQPGSVFKVLASFAPALDMGKITPATVIVDEPYKVGNYEPHNWWGETYRGPSTIRAAIRDSMNILAVKNMHDTGLEACFDYLLKFGFTTLVNEPGKDLTLSTALGGITYGVPQVEVAAAYGAIANEGVLEKSIYYTRVLNHNGEPLLENQPKPERVIKPSTAYLLTDMMKDVVTSGTGKKANFINIKMPIAGKTGTTSDNKDLMFVGYTPYYVASVWLGYDKPKPMLQATSNEGAHLTMFRYVMEQIHKDLPYKDFERPESVKNAEVCTVSGQLAISGLCDGTVRNELFAVENMPTQLCDVHIKTMFDSSNNKLANPYCPSSLLVEGVAQRRLVINEEGQEHYEIQGEICTDHGPETYFSQQENNANQQDNDLTNTQPTNIQPTNDPAQMMEEPTPQPQNTDSPIPDGIPIEEARRLEQERRKKEEEWWRLQQLGAQEPTPTPSPTPPQTIEAPTQHK